MSLPDWREEPIDRKHDHASFDCFEPELNEFLRRHARQSHERGAAKTFLAIARSDGKTISCRSPVCAPSRVAQAAFFRLFGTFQAGKRCLALQVGSSPLRRAASSTANDTTPASVHSIP